MNIWYIIFFVALGFFIIKTLISFFIGDIDVDFDADGDVDFDLSSMFSFKGLLHFILGLSTYLSIIAKLDNTYSGYGTYNYEWYHYLIGVSLGFVFMFLLYELYKFMMKLNHSSQDNPDFNNCNCSILINNGNGYYTVLVKTYSGTFKTNIRAYQNVENLPIGSEYQIIRDLDTNEYMLNNSYSI